MLLHRLLILLTAGTCDTSDSVSAFPRVWSDADVSCQDLHDNCINMHAELFILGTRECKHPAAELCPHTCGLCRNVGLAHSCMSRDGACTFHGESVDWVAFLQKAVARSECPGAQLLSERPPLAEFPDFFSSSEADHLVEVSKQLGFEQEDQLDKEIRNVQKSDCQTHRCMFQPFVGEVHRRISALLGVPSSNFEPLEFLSYGPGQHYVEHHDTDPDFHLSSFGVGSGLRILTVFLYLSDVERGGHTFFTRSNLRIQPQKGKLVVWANVEPNMKEVSHFAFHASEAVKVGHKFAANFWVHPCDFRSPEMHAPWWC